MEKDVFIREGYSIQNIIRINSYNFRIKYKNIKKVPLEIQGVSRLVNITAGGDFLGLCDQKRSYIHVSDFGQLRSYGHFLIPVHALV